MSVIVCDDWRDLSPVAAATLLAQERQRWIDALQWDPADNFAQLEAGRAAGRVPGFVARRGSQPVGWTFFILHQATLQVGALNGASAGIVRLLLERVLDTPEADMARRLSCFLFPDNQALPSALVRRRFDLRPQQYLVRPLDEGEWRRAVPPTGTWHGHGQRLRNWSIADAADCVRLLARAYEHEAGAECFAPAGRIDEWAQYFGQLVHTAGCGTWLPQASFVVQARGAALPIGLVVTTAVSPTTAHVAQVAVDPQWRGHGVARTLVQAAASAAVDAGYERVSLLVDSGNVPARTLYDSLGFRPGPQFLFGSRKSQTRVSSAA